MKILQLVAILPVMLSGATIITSAQSRTAEPFPFNLLEAETVYTPVKKAEISDLAAVKAEIGQILMRTKILDEKNGIVDISSNDISVIDDRIEIKANNQNATIYFSDFPDYIIKVNKLRFPNTKLKPNSEGTISIWEKVDGKLTKIVYKPYQIKFANLISFNFGDRNYLDAKKLADDLFFVQNVFNKKRLESQISQFDSIAAQYRALKVKPPVSEEQRRYIVQANAFNQAKNYNKAIELYKKAIELDQTAFPSAYLNLALLSAQVFKYDVAIFNMKKYLLLEPDANDARSAQDKIYEWEIQIEK